MLVNAGLLPGTCMISQASVDMIVFSMESGNDLSVSTVVSDQMVPVT